MNAESANSFKPTIKRIAKAKSLDRQSASQSSSPEVNNGISTRLSSLEISSGEIGSKVKGNIPDKLETVTNGCAAEPMTGLESVTNGFAGVPMVDIDSLSTTEVLSDLLLKELQAALRTPSSRAKLVADRIAKEVERICDKSDRIQNSGEIQSWQITLAKHRLQKCLAYYNLGSRQGRVDLHSTLSAIVYRYIAPANCQLGFQARCNLIEDFLQGFYIESVKAFRRENGLPIDYSPRSQLELAEYMAFTEHYAKRRINLPGCRNQQLIVLRARSYSNRQPPETSVDIELAVESARGEDAELHQRSAAIQQVREQMVSESVDPAEGVLRDRVVAELMEYLETQGQSDCVDYLTLKLQDLSAPEIDQILGLTARERDYLQQRFKYHVEKFARNHQWKLVHEWIGADLDQNLGLSSQQWRSFTEQLSPEQQQLLDLKRAQAKNKTAALHSDQEIAKTLKCTTKQMQKRWHKLLDLAWQVRNMDN